MFNLLFFFDSLIFPKEAEDVEMIHTYGFSNAVVRSYYAPLD